MAHTAGPWTLYPPDAEMPIAVVATDDICEMASYATPDDARLIAAAPDLLAALRLLMEGSDYRSIDLGHGPMPPRWHGIRTPTPEAMEVARLAIEKAEG